MAVEQMLTEEMPASALVARVLEEAGIEMVFGISGGHTGRIVSALSKYQNSIRTVLVREESLGGVMAEIYGRLTRRPGVLLGQGPWVLGNGLIGTIEAYLSSSPMLLLTDFSDAPRFTLHAPYQQATGDYGSWDARRAFGGVTKQVMQAHDPIAAVQATQLAIKHAMAGQPGPVAVLFSHDALAGTVAPGLAADALSDPALPAAGAAARRAGAWSRPRPGRSSRRRSRWSSPATACASPRPMTSCAGWSRPRGCRWRRPRPARAALPRPTRWRSGCSAPLARRRPTPAWPKPTSCWSSARNCRRATRPGRTGLARPACARPLSRSTSSRATHRGTIPAEHVLLGDAAVVLGQLIEAVGSSGTGRRQRPSGASPLIANGTAISTTVPTLPTTCRSCRSG